MTQEQSGTQTMVEGLPLSLDDPTVNRSQETRIYYRPHYRIVGKERELLGYFPTLPLPADPMSMIRYVRKGFKLWPPGIEPKEERQSVQKAAVVGKVQPSAPDKITCPVEGCTKIVSSYSGLARHTLRIHKLK